MWGDGIAGGRGEKRHRACSAQVLQPWQVPLQEDGRYWLSLGKDRAEPLRGARQQHPDHQGKGARV